jgi:uncharacterized NAD-dependent epimerase/dehydratase family protein
MNEKHRTSVKAESWGILIDQIAMDAAAAVEELRETSIWEERQDVPRSSSRKSWTRR